MTKTDGTIGSTVDRNGITHRKGIAKVNTSQSKDYIDPFNVESISVKKYKKLLSDLNNTLLADIDNSNLVKPDRLIILNINNNIAIGLQFGIVSQKNKADNKFHFCYKKNSNFRQN